MPSQTYPLKPAIKKPLSLAPGLPPDYQLSEDPQQTRYVRKRRTSAPEISTRQDFPQFFRGSHGQGQKPAVLSAAGDVFSDDIIPGLGAQQRIESRRRAEVPDTLQDAKRPARQPAPKSPRSTQERAGLPPRANSQHTEVHSIDSAGDIHVGAMLDLANVENSMESEVSDESDDITLDPELKADEAMLEGGRKRDVPAINANWQRKDRRKRRFGSRIRKSVRNWAWRPKRSASSPPGKTKREADEQIDTQRCLLHAEESTYDRTHVLQSRDPRGLR